MSIYEKAKYKTKPIIEREGSPNGLHGGKEYLNMIVKQSQLTDGQGETYDV